MELGLGLGLVCFVMRMLRGVSSSFDPCSVANSNFNPSISARSAFYLSDGRRYKNDGPFVCACPWPRSRDGRLWVASACPILRHGQREALARASSRTTRFRPSAAGCLPVASGRTAAGQAMWCVPALPARGGVARTDALCCLTRRCTSRARQPSTTAESRSGGFGRQRCMVPTPRVPRPG